MEFPWRRNKAKEMNEKTQRFLQEIKIEKNIPVPHISHRSGYWLDLLGKMEISDSILFKEHKTSHSLCKRIYDPAKKLNMRFTCRKDGTGIRIWRIK